MSIIVIYHAMSLIVLYQLLPSVGFHCPSVIKKNTFKSSCLKPLCKLNQTWLLWSFSGPLSKLYKCHFQQFFSYMYIEVVSLIGGGNRRKPATCRKSLTNFIT